MKLLNTFLRLSPSFVRLFLISYLFYSKQDKVLYEFSLISGLVLASVLLFSLDLNHKIMQIIPKCDSNNTKSIINTRYLELQSFLSLIGAFIFYYLVLWFKIESSFINVFIFYISEHVVIEMGRLLRINEKIISASLMDFSRTIFFLTLILIGSYFNLTTNYLILSHSFSVIFCLLILNKKIKNELFLRLNSNFSIHRIYRLLKKLLDYKILFLLIGTVSLRYMQVIDKKLINDFIDTEAAARWSVFIGISMFIYRFIDSFSFQFLTPKLIRLNSMGIANNFLKTEIVRVFFLSILLLIVTYFLGIFYVENLRPDVIVHYEDEMPFILLLVLSYILFLLSSIVIFSEGKLLAYSILKSLPLFFLVFIIFNLNSYSLKLFALIITGIYLLSTISNCILWLKIKK